MRDKVTNAPMPTFIDTADVIDIVSVPNHQARRPGEDKEIKAAWRDPDSAAVGS